VIIDITPIRATLRYKRQGNFVDSSGNLYPCYAKLVFRNWGQVYTGNVCLIYQLSADMLSLAVDSFIDLSDLDETKILTGVCQTAVPAPGSGSCVAAPGIPTETDELINVEVFCLRPGGNATDPNSYDKYLGLYEVYRSYYQRPTIHIYDMFGVDRSVNPGYVDIDPSAVMIANGYFNLSNYTAAMSFTDGTTLTNLPVNIEIKEASQHTVEVTYTISAPTVPAQSRLKDIELYYNVGNGQVIVGKISSIMIPALITVNYTDNINTMIRL